MNFNLKRQFFFLLGLCFLISGCVQVFPPAKKVDALLITPLSIKEAQQLKMLPAVTWQLIVSEPSLNAYLDKNLVMVEDQSGVVKYLAHVEWPEPLPDFLKSLIVDGFIDSQKIMGVSGSHSHIQPNYLLQLDVNKCHIQKTADGYQTVLEATAFLIDFKTRKTIGVQPFSGHVKLKSPEKKEIKAAFEQLLTQYMLKLIPWTLTAPTKKDTL
jgi:ABC-type uncharacterized transport system auxiliary subunit